MNGAAHGATRAAPAPPDGGMAQDRLDRIAARRAFVQAKQCFADCVEALDAAAPLTAWLAQAVRQAHEPADLWLLRNALFAALRRERSGAASAARLRRTLAGLFPQRFEASGFGDSLD